MSRRRQPGGVDEVGVVHAETPCAVVHLLHEQLRDAGDLFRQCHRGVVAGGDADALEKLLHGDALTLRQEHLTAAHAGGVGGDRHHVVVGECAAVDGVHGQKERHNLRNACRLQLLVLVLGEEDRAGGFFHQQRGAGGQGQLHRRGANRQQRGEEEKKEKRGYGLFHTVASMCFFNGYAAGQDVHALSTEFPVAKRRMM